MGIFGITQEDLRASNLRMSTRLFGESGNRCLNLYEGEGILGELLEKINEIKDGKSKLRIGRRLFGRMGSDCLNLYDGEGILGEMKMKIKTLMARVNELETKKKKKKKAKK